MKRFIIRGSCLCFSVFVWLGLWIAIGQAASWPSDKGELCWQGDGSNTIIRLFITNMGNRHYVVNGIVMEPGGYVEPIIGSEEIVGKEIYVTSTSAGGDASATWTFIGRWVMDKSTLDGTLEIMGVTYNVGDPTPHMDYDGPLTLAHTPCPKAVKLVSPQGGETLTSEGIYTIA